METFTSDDQTEEAVKQWWKENGKSIIAGAVIGIGAVLGWQGWQAHVTQQGREAAAVYDKMFASLVTAPEAATQEAQVLVTEYGSTPYAALAELAMAKLKVESGDSAAAMEHLRKAMASAKMPEIQAVARLRLARLTADGGKPDEALALLAEVNGFSASGEEVRGDILLAQGKRDEAKAAYQKALEAGGNQATLRMKLDDLGG